MDTATTEMPANIREAFDTYPEAQAVLVEMGHAWGKCKFGGACPLTGLHMGIGTSYRHLDFWTRTGVHFQGTVAGESAAFMNFTGGGVAYSTWRRWNANWLDGIDLATLPVGTTITLARDARGQYKVSTDSWFVVEIGGKRSWQKSGTWNTRSTPAQLLASFKRLKSALAWKLEAPR